MTWARNLNTWTDTPAAEQRRQARELQQPIVLPRPSDDFDARQDRFTLSLLGVTAAPTRLVECEVTVVESLHLAYGSCDCGWRTEGDLQVVLEEAEFHGPLNPMAVTA